MVVDRMDLTLSAAHEQQGWIEGRANRCAEFSGVSLEYYNRYYSRWKHWIQIDQSLCGDLWSRSEMGERA